MNNPDSALHVAGQSYLEGNADQLEAALIEALKTELATATEDEVQDLGNNQYRLAGNGSVIYRQNLTVRGILRIAGCGSNCAPGPW